MKRTITPERLRQYEQFLLSKDSMARESVRHYVRNVTRFAEFLDGREVTQETLEGFKAWLVEDQNYKKSSANTFVLSARSFCEAMEWDGLGIKSYTMEYQYGKRMGQRLTRHEYAILVHKAMNRRKYWLAMLIQVLCHMDLRYSELPALTAEAVRRGSMEIERWHHRICVPFPGALLAELRNYMRLTGISSGILIRTSTGKLINRSNVWRDFKQLCTEVGVDTGRITLHSLKMPGAEDYYPYISMEE